MNRIDAQIDDMFKLVEGDHIGDQVRDMQKLLDAIKEHQAQRKAEQLDAMRLADLERNAGT